MEPTGSGAERAQRRLALHERLAAVIGDEEAETLMESLPPVRWDELARQRDLLAAREDLVALRTDVDGLRTDVDGLRTDVDGLRIEVQRVEERSTLRLEATEHRLRTEMVTMRGEIVERIDRTAHQLDSTLSERIHTTALRMLAILVPTTITSVAVAVGAAFAAGRMG